MSISPHFPPFMSFRYCEHDLTYKDVEETNVYLFVLGKDNLQRTYYNCIVASDHDDFIELDRKIQRDGQQVEDGMIYQPLCGEVCLVKINGHWFRSKYLGIGPHGPSVYCLDFGVVCSATPENFRVRNFSLHSCFVLKQLWILSFS